MPKQTILVVDDEAKMRRVRFILVQGKVTCSKVGSVYALLKFKALINSAF